jgi:hypothetical protein
MGNELIPLRGVQVPAAASSAPATIKSGISALIAAFATGRLDDERRIELRDLYVEAIAGFDVAIAEAALRHLRFSNPRNPFHPSPQDVREACYDVAAERHHAYLRSLHPDLRAARESVIRDGGWRLSEADLITAAEALLQAEAPRRAETAAVVAEAPLKRMAP